MFDRETPITIFQKTNMFTVINYLNRMGMAKKSEIERYVDKGYRSVGECLLILLDMDLVEFIPMDPKKKDRANYWKIKDKGKVVAVTMNCLNEYLKAEGELHMDGRALEEFAVNLNCGSSLRIRLTDDE